MGRKAASRLGRQHNPRNGSRQLAPVRYACEPLEQRTLLAANIHMLSAALSDAGGSTFGSVGAGQRFVYMRIDFQTTDLPNNAVYMVQATFGGQTFYSLQNKGAGLAGTNNFNIIAGPWTKAAGIEGGVAVLDVTNAITETNESDNADTFNANGVVPPFKFVQPIEGTPWVDWNISNYVDLDAGDGIEDYAGGTYSYDGHNGWDFHLANFRQADAGVEIYAAAPGTVIDAHDGEFDRNTEGMGQPSNYVEIDHGGGWVTKYVHLRRDTVKVAINDVVGAGDLLGMVGSSGNSSGPHLHFAVYYNGNLVEPNIAGSSYFQVPLGYSADFPTVLDSGVVNYDPSSENKEGPTHANVFLEGESVFYWVSLGGINAGDSVEWIFYRPDDTVAASFPTVSGQVQGSWNWAQYNLPSAAPAGEWEASLKINGVEKSRDSFFVQSTGAPQVRVYTTLQYVIDGRQTPFDLGTINQGEVSITANQSFTVFNTGQVSMSTGTMTVPAGFLVTEPLSGVIPAGGSDSFTIALDPNTAATGHKIGTVSFTTNDVGFGESFFTFRVEGTVNAFDGISLSDEPDTVYIRRNGANTEIFINKPPGPAPDWSIPFAGLGKFDLYTYGGDDVVTVDFADGVPLHTDGFRYFGYPGTDTLIILGDSRGETGLLDFNDMIWQGIPMRLDEIERIQLFGNGGNDEITLGAGYLFELIEDVTVVGGTGTDTLNLDDSLDIQSVFYTVSVNTVGSGTFLAVYDEVEELEIEGNTEGDTFFVFSTPATTTVTLNGNGGDDYFQVAPFNNHLEQVKGAIAIHGGAGVDTLAMHDQDHLLGEVYDITSSQISSTRTGSNPNLFEAAYSTLEQVILNSGSGDSVFNIHSTGASTPFFINAGDGDDWFFLTPTSKDLGDIDGVLSLFGEEGADDRIILSDNDFPGPLSPLAQFTDDQFDTSHSSPVNYGSVESIAYNASNAGTSTVVVSLPPGLTLTLNGGADEDVFVIGEVLTGLAPLGAAGNITVDGKGGNDFLAFHDHPGVANDVYTLSDAYFHHSAMSGFVHYLDIQNIQINAGTGNNIISVTALNAPLSINAGTGDDFIFLGSPGGLLDPLTQNILIGGEGGTDTLFLNDLGQLAARTHTITATTYTRTAFPIVTYGTLEALQLYAGSGADTIGVNSTAAGTPVWINGGPGLDTVNVNETTPGAPVTHLPSTGDDSIFVNTDAAGQAHVLFTQTQRIGALTMRNGGSAQLTPGFDKVLTTTRLDFLGTARLDLTDNSLIHDHTALGSIAVVESLLNMGFNGGSWTGDGIFSSVAAVTPNRALGFAASTDLFSLFPADFAGQPVDAHAALVRYTLPGDATLDRIVDLRDLMPVANNWFQSNRRWSQGDFDFNQIVDKSDLGDVAGNWQQVLAEPAPPLPAASTTARRTATRTPTRIASQILGT